MSVIIMASGRRWGDVIDVATLLASDPAGVVWVEEGGAAAIADKVALIACVWDVGDVRKCGREELRLAGVDCVRRVV